MTQQPLHPANHCRYIDADFQACAVEAVVDVGASGRGKLPRCQKHKNSSPANSALNISRYMFKRASDRGMVSQAELFFHLEAEMEKKLREWNYLSGRVIDDSLAKIWDIFPNDWWK